MVVFGQAGIEWHVYITAKPAPYKCVYLCGAADICVGCLEYSPLPALFVCPDQVGKSDSIRLAVVLCHAVEHDTSLCKFPTMRTGCNHGVEDGSIRWHVLHR